MHNNPTGSAAVCETLGPTSLAPATVPPNLLPSPHSDARVELQEVVATSRCLSNEFAFEART